jgi:hypothetical protein
MELLSNLVRSQAVGKGENTSREPTVPQGRLEIHAKKPGLKGHRDA